MTDANKILTIGRGGRSMDLGKPRVMAIINVTPDSFWAVSRAPGVEAAARRIEKAVREGADILDIGGYSSRPGAGRVGIDEEWRRVRIGLEAVAQAAPGAVVSVDTFRPQVMRRALEEFGPCMVNDIYGGASQELAALAARWEVPYVAMHMRGTPATMHALTDYPRGVAVEVAEWGAATVRRLERAGVKDIVLDPGLGFAKTVEQNYRLLAGLDGLAAAGRPVLVGLSRKSMIYRPLGCTPDEVLAGTVALGWEALRQGASVLRVHDVAEAVQSVRVWELYAAALTDGRASGAGSAGGARDGFPAAGPSAEAGGASAAGDRAQTP